MCAHATKGTNNSVRLYGAYHDADHEKDSRQDIAIAKLFGKGLRRTIYEIEKGNFLPFRCTVGDHHCEALAAFNVDNMNALQLEAEKIKGRIPHKKNGLSQTMKQSSPADVLKATDVEMSPEMQAMVYARVLSFGTTFERDRDGKPHVRTNQGNIQSALSSQISPDVLKVLIANMRQRLNQTAIGYLQKQSTLSREEFLKNTVQAETRYGKFTFGGALRSAKLSIGRLKEEGIPFVIIESKRMKQGPKNEETSCQAEGGLIDIEREKRTDLEKEELRHLQRKARFYERQSAPMEEKESLLPCYSYRKIGEEYHFAPPGTVSLPSSAPVCVLQVGFNEGLSDEQIANNLKGLNIVGELFIDAATHHQFEDMDNERVQRNEDLAPLPPEERDNIAALRKKAKSRKPNFSMHRMYMAKVGDLISRKVP